MSSKLTPAELERRGAAAIRHGARSQAVVRRTGGYLKQSILQPLGIRQGELGRLAREHLDLYVRAKAKVVLYDKWADEHGFLSAGGESPPWIREYYAALNAARLALREFERCVSERPARTPLELYLEGSAEEETS